MDKQGLCSWLDGQLEPLSGMARAIWEKPELAMQESFASGLQKQALKAAGFDIRTLPGLPTAFVAEYGAGSPVLGILGEYDALPDLSQQAGPPKKPLVEHGPGHGCGHNLLGTAGVGAALALARALAAGSIPGRVRYYGCPAEETITGKTLMARAGDAVRRKGDGLHPVRPGGRAGPACGGKGGVRGGDRPAEVQLYAG